MRLQDAETEWLGDIIICTVGKTGQLIFLRFPGCEHDDRHIRILTDIFQDLEAVQSGKHAVQKDQIDEVVVGIIEGEGLFSVFGRENGVLIGGEKILQCPPELLIVLDDQNEIPCIFHKNLPVW